MDLSQYSDDQLAEIAGAPLSVRNNNPGNMRPVGQSTGFQKFDTPEAGMDAMKRDLMAKVTGKSSAMKMNYGENYAPTLRNVISTWAPPKADGNNTGSYISFVAKGARINPDTPLKPEDIDKIMPLMTQFEGGNKAAAHFGKETQVADSGQIMTDAAPDNGPDLSSISDDELMKIAGEGIETQQETAKNVQAEPQSIGRTALDQGLQGATFGFADEAMDTIGTLYAGYMRPDLFDNNNLKPTLDEARQMSQTRLAEQVKQNPGTAIASNLGGAVLTGVAGGTTKAGTALANSVRSGGAAARITKGAAAGAASGAAYGAGTAEDGQRIEGAQRGAISGAAVGGLIPGAGAAAGAVKSTVVPKLSKETVALAEKAKQLGIPLRLDQISPTRVRKTVQKVSQEVPFSGVDAFEETQRKAFSKALAKTIGQDAEDLSPATIQKFLDDSSKKFNSITTGQRVNFNAAAKQNLDAIVADAEDSLTGDVAAIVKRNVDKLGEDIATGAVSGEKIASFRSNLIARIPNADSGAKAYLSKIVSTIDDVVEKGLPKDKADLLSQTRREWRNFKTIEPLLEEAENGVINPTKLLNRVKASPYIKASRNATGSDDLIDLARIGKQFLPKAGGSDTFQKTVLGGGVGALGVTALSNPLLALGIATKGAAVVGANRGVQAANSSQRLVDLAVKSSKATNKQLSKPNIIYPATTNAAGRSAGNEKGPLRVTIRPSDKK